MLTFTPQHTYALPGAYNISVTVVDKDGGTGSGSVVAPITGVVLNNGQLIISGTSGDDTITVRKPGTPVAYWTLNDPNTGTTITDSASNPDTAPTTTRA